MNLSYIDSDSELFQAFSNVPSNSIVVFEDVDTMSCSLLPRTNIIDNESKFNLSTFLSILDGHTLEDGIIFIMTTNHQERLDPAIIRPGTPFILSTNIQILIIMQVEWMFILNSPMLHSIRCVVYIKW
jgi:ATP-dependent Zn protease